MNELPTRFKKILKAKRMSEKDMLWLLQQGGESLATVLMLAELKKIRKLKRQVIDLPGGPGRDSWVMGDDDE